MSLFVNFMMLILWLKMNRAVRLKRGSSAADLQIDLNAETGWDCTRQRRQIPVGGKPDFQDANRGGGAPFTTADGSGLGAVQEFSDRYKVLLVT